MPPRPPDGHLRAVAAALTGPLVVVLHLNVVGTFLVGVHMLWVVGLSGTGVPAGHRAAFLDLLAAQAVAAALWAACARYATR